MSAVVQHATPTDLARSILFDETERPDGFTNRQRAAFVLGTFGATTIDLDDVFDYTAAFWLDDANLVAAYLHLAVLQAFYYELLYYYQWIDDAEWEELRQQSLTTTHDLGAHLQLLLAGIPPRNLAIID